MNKNSIKIIKRADAAIIANAKIQSAGDAKQTTLFNKEETENRSRRDIAGTISSWIDERRENNRLEEIAANNQMRGGKSRLSEI